MVSMVMCLVIYTAKILMLSYCPFSFRQHFCSIFRNRGKSIFIMYFKLWRVCIHFSYLCTTLFKQFVVLLFPDLMLFLNFFFFFHLLTGLEKIFWIFLHVLISRYFDNTRSDSCQKSSKNKQACIIHTWHCKNE